MLMLGIFHLVFGLDITLRAFRKKAFSERSRHSLAINLAISSILLLVVLIVAQTLGTHVTACSGGVIFLVASLQLNSAAFAILMIFICLFLVMAATIAYRLKRIINIEPAHRIEATRMVYYLLLTVVIEAMIAPFFSYEANLYTSYPYGASNLAEYILVMSGAFVAILHLFMRANAARMAIKSSETPWHKKRYFRFFGPSDLEIINISPPLHLIYPTYRVDEKRLIRTPTSQRTYNSLPSTPSNSFPMKPAPLSLSMSKHINKEYMTTPLTGGSSRNAFSPGRSLMKEALQTPLTARCAKDTVTTPHANEPAVRSAGQQPYCNFFPSPTSDTTHLPATVYSPAPSSHAHLKFPTSPISPPRSVPSPILPPTTYQPHSPHLSNIRESPLPITPPHVPSPPLPPMPTNLWNQRRTAISSTVGTVPIGIRLSSVPTALVAGHQASAELPTIETVLETGPIRMHLRNAPFDDSFTMAFKDQVKDAQGRDLNSFQWIEDGSDDDGDQGFRLEDLPISPGTIWRQDGDEGVGLGIVSLYAMDEEMDTRKKKSRYEPYRRSSEWI
jgi:hypothetical protein